MIKHMYSNINRDSNVVIIAMVIMITYDDESLLDRYEDRLMIADVDDDDDEDSCCEW